MRPLALLCVAALAAAAHAEPQSTTPRAAKVPPRPPIRVAPVDPYAPPPKPARPPAKPMPTGPVDPYANSITPAPPGCAALPSRECGVGSSAAVQAAYATAWQHIVELRREALQLVTARLSAGQPVTEYDVVQVVVRGMAVRRLVGPFPTVAAGINTADAYYAATAQRTAAIQIGDPIVIGIAGKVDTPEGVLAAQTWCAVADKTVPGRMASAFATVRIARDRAIAAVMSRARTRRGGNDDRPSFTVGQGIYFPGQFGLRSEVSLYSTSAKSAAPPAVQTAIETLLPVGQSQQASGASN